MVESSAEIDGAELEVLRAGVRLMALRAFGDADTADEVAQEAIVRAFHVLRTSRPEKLGPFVAGIARHVIADIIRARSRGASLEELDSSAEPRSDCDALVALCTACERDQVRAALDQLGGDDRELLRLLFFEGLLPSEIAERMGAPPERIRQRKVRALARLRAAFDESPRDTSVRHADRASPTIKSGATRAFEPSRPGGSK